MSLNTFLKSCRTATGVTRVVVGNEAGDADSLVAAICLAWLHDQAAPGSTIPATHVARDDLALRTETALLLREAGAELSDIPSLPLPDGCAVQGHAVSLVDHNAPVGAAAGWADLVDEILDHHRDAGRCAQVLGERRCIAFDNAAGVGIGSACTLVAERALSRFGSALPRDVAVCLLGVIALDTGNMSPAVGKGTPRDAAAVQGLERVLSGGDDGAWAPERTAALFKRLSDAKFDPAFWAGLTHTQRILFDYKTAAPPAQDGARRGGGLGRCGLASVLMPLAACVGAPAERVDGGFAAAARDVIADQGLSALLVLGYVVDPAPAREIAVACASAGRAAVESGLVAPLLKADKLELSLTGTASDASSGMTVWWMAQGNAKASRKQVMPVVEAALASCAPQEGDQ